MDVSVHQAQRGGKPRTAPPVHECLGLLRDTRNTLDARRHAHDDEREEARCYDSGEDQSLSLDLPGP